MWQMHIEQYKNNFWHTFDIFQGFKNNNKTFVEFHILAVASEVLAEQVS